MSTSMQKELVFKELTFRNFISYGNNITKVSLDFSGKTILIVGEDLDNTVNGKVANGTGKTTILNALAFVLYDQVISDIPKNELINNINKKDLEVTVSFSNGDGHEYFIRRVRKNKAMGGDNVFIYVDGTTKDHEITPDSMAAANKKIEELLGLSFDVFVRIVVFSADNRPFLSLPSRHASQVSQVSIIEELFGITIVSKRADDLKKHISDTEKQIQTQKSFIELKKQEIERISKQLIAAENRVSYWESTTAATIQNLRLELASIDSTDLTAELEAHAQLKEARELKKQLNAMMQLQLPAVTKLEREITALMKELSSLKNATCPYCLQAMHDVDTKIEEVNASIACKLTELDALQAELDITNEAIASQSITIDELTPKITILNVEQLVQSQKNSHVTKQRILDLEQATNPHTESLTDIRAVANDEELDYSIINTLENVLAHQKFLLKLLTKNDSFIRKRLLNENIPYLNEKLGVYVEELGLPHIVEFTHELEAKISQFGRPLGFGNLSAGQRARVNLALAFAFDDVQQKRHVPINIRLFDEVFDVGLDSVGIQSAVRAIKRKTISSNCSMFVISHRDEVYRMFDDILTVQKKDGFSNIIV